MDDNFVLHFIRVLFVVDPSFWTANTEFADKKSIFELKTSIFDQLLQCELANPRITRQNCTCIFATLWESCRQTCKHMKTSRVPLTGCLRPLIWNYVTDFVSVDQCFQPFFASQQPFKVKKVLFGGIPRWLNRSRNGQNCNKWRNPCSSTLVCCGTLIEIESLLYRVSPCKSLVELEVFEKKRIFRVISLLLLSEISRKKS